MQKKFIETNICTVFIHHFFKGHDQVSDKDIRAHVLETLDYARPREWYCALTDYGVYLKKEFGNASVRSKSYTRQSKFRGSDRQIRGAILRVLVEKGYGGVVREELFALVSSDLLCEHERYERVLAGLRADGFCTLADGVVKIC